LPLDARSHHWQVTEDNKRLYVDKLVAWKSGEESAQAIAALRRGLHEILPVEGLQRFTASQFLSLITGRSDVDVAAMAATCVFTDGMTAEHTSAAWFWKAFGELTPSQRKLVLKFVTGTYAR
jgi:hypothetical protein